VLYIQATRILRSLIRYVKALQKDRIHIMNRYRHQLQTSPSDAELNRPQMVDHLASSDRQLTAALHMLDRLTHYNDKILKQIGTYRPIHNRRAQHWLAWREMIRPQAARRPQCAAKWDRNLKPKLAIMRQCTSVTDRRTDRQTDTDIVA